MKKFKISVVSALVLGLLLNTSFVLAKGEAEERGPLSKMTFIHYKKNPVKPSGVGKGKSTTCYGFLSSGAKWKTIEPYEINPTNPDGLDETFVKEVVDNSVAEWENFGGNIFGNSSISTSAAYLPNSIDTRNTVSFGDYSDDNVIAVTSVWGYFSGAPKFRELVEWDMLFNTRYSWGDALLNPALMDLQNIATHELGHSAGLADLYNSSCSAETMYGYSSEGEISKRDLNLGDIAGIRKLYQ